MRKSIHTREYELLRSELRAARAKANLSQRDMALRLRVPQSVVAKMESGERRLDVIEFCWFLAACGLDPLAAFARIHRQVSVAGLNLPRAGGRRK